ncbi:LysM peptidoglycan-binding domain-containing protein [Coraliomargarita algicola]|uniref:LysM peptidoglycan-binding domain-containing protein n=1 Tax=Coraliomargarita algicola TaxID=3092156 RepID=A0ABZ0RJX0_9BACT|nr:LysM peptidoglycan-binding domain-containing protein [Coraliomargarita sp. J2-16]WPJ96491.1 LysM peptidoglycan-binding domain-containing protein [Coraliomargarita sp. J2-16]
MIKSLITALLCLCTLCTFVTQSAAQDNLRVTVANLNQDVSLLSQSLKTLRLEIEELHRENARLRAQVAAASSNRDTEAQITNLASAIETLRREYRSADESQKQQILTEVNRQVSALAKETQAAINSIANAVENQPQIATPVHFSDDFPKTGKPYVVRSGDTLSKIARDHGSTIKNIQNANKIVNPSRDLKVGETIFIPIAQ